MSEPVAYGGATLIDGTGSDPLDDAVLVIENGRVAQVTTGKHYRRRSEQATVDLSGLFVIPGLIDCHVHFRGTLSHSAREWVLESNMQQAILSVAQARSML